MVSRFKGQVIAGLTIATLYRSSLRLEISTTRLEGTLCHSRVIRWWESTSQRSRLQTSDRSSQKPRGQTRRKNRLIAIPHSNQLLAKKAESCSKSTKEWRTSRRRKTMVVDWGTYRAWLRYISTWSEIRTLIKRWGRLSTESHLSRSCRFSSGKSRPSSSLKVNEIHHYSLLHMITIVSIALIRAKSRRHWQTVVGWPKMTRVGALVPSFI